MRYFFHSKLLDKIALDMLLRSRNRGNFSIFSPFLILCNFEIFPPITFLSYWKCCNINLEIVCFCIGCGYTELYHNLKFGRIQWENLIKNLAICSEVKKWPKNIRTIFWLRRVYNGILNFNNQSAAKWLKLIVNL